MISSLFRRPDRNIAILYGAIVAQTRDARFYEAYGVPDTVLGRFDLLLLHVALLLRRLREGDTVLAQGVFDEFCRDMDHNLREMGISDQGVPRQMRRVGEAFYGRAQAYDAALGAQGEGSLADALARNVYAGTAEPDVAALRLAAYVRQTAIALDRQPFDELARGVVKFPVPSVPALAAE